MCVCVCVCECACVHVCVGGWERNSYVDGINDGINKRGEG